MKNDRRWMSHLLDERTTADVTLVALPWQRGQIRAESKERRELYAETVSEPLTARH